MPSLLVISGPLEGEQIEVDRALIVGRHDADVVIDDPELSRRHLEIRPDGDGLLVEDLGSTNGTFIDARAIDAPTHLNHGDRVKLGATVLEVQIVVDAGATRLRPTGEDPGATRLRSAAPAPVQPIASAGAAAAAPAAEASPSALPAHAAPSSPTPGPTLLPEQIGAFRPPSIRRGGGLASRSWVPVALSFGTAILTAIALVIYFAQR